MVEDGLSAGVGFGSTSAVEDNGDDRQAPEVTDPELREIVHTLQAARELPLPERVDALEAIHAALSRRLDAVDGT